MKTIKIDDELYSLILKKMDEMKAKSPNQLLKTILSGNQSNCVFEGFNKCKARCVGGVSYLIKCEDGKAAVVPEKMLFEFAKGKMYFVIEKTCDKVMK